MSVHGDSLRWLYRGGRPSGLAKLMNRVWARASAAGIWPSRAGALEVRGRTSGKIISLPVVIADYEGSRYLVSMLGSGANWVHNVEAAGGRADLCHGRREAIALVTVEPALRAPIIRRYLECAPGARPHIPVDRHAPLEAFDHVAAAYPVYRIEPRPDAT